MGLHDWGLGCCSWLRSDQETAGSVPAAGDDLTLCCVALQGVYLPLYRSTDLLLDSLEEE